MQYFTQIPGDVNTKGFVPGYNGLDPVSRFERPELFELLRGFERGLRHLCICQEEVPAVDVQAYVLVHGAGERHVAE